ncbi:hypothetical protein Tco_0468858 [Tanacetum coccineum]
MPGCSWRGHLRGVHIHFCPSVLGGDTCEGYIFITARVFLEGTPVMGTYGFHYCPGVLGGDTYYGYIVHWFHELRLTRYCCQGSWLMLFMLVNAAKNVTAVRVKVVTASRFRKVPTATVKAVRLP